MTLPGDRPTPHFSWGEMTATSHADLEAANRMEAMPFALALAATAAMLEVKWFPPALQNISLNRKSRTLANT